MENKEIKVISKSVFLGKEIDVYGTVDEPLFKAKDVAGWLDILNVSDMIKNIDQEEKVLDSIYTLGGMQEVWLLTEDGLYEVLMQSRKPVAKQFKKGVKTILKSIRKDRRLYGKCSDIGRGDENQADVCGLERKVSQSQ